MRKKTLRQMTPLAREIAKLSNEATSLARRMRNLAKRTNQENGESQRLLKKTLAEIRERRI
jgi:hypothetical protein